MPTSEIHELIEAYLEGKLSGAALKSFEDRLQSDPDFASLVALFKDMDTAVSKKNVLNFQKLVQQEGENFLQNKPESNLKAVKINRRLFALAASLLFIVSLFLLWYTISGDVSGKDLFAQHFETYELNDSYRSNTTKTSQFSLGIQYYQEKKYQQASIVFQKLANADEYDMVIAFCLANAYLNQNPPKLMLSEREFQKIISDGNSIYVIRSKWYKALILIEKGEFRQSKELLLSVANSSDQLKSQATELLKKIKSK